MAFSHRNATLNFTIVDATKQCGTYTLHSVKAILIREKKPPIYITSFISLLECLGSYVKAVSQSGADNSHIHLEPKMASIFGSNRCVYQ